MKVAVAMLTIASLGATFAVARPADQAKTGHQTSAGETTKKQPKKKKSKKETTDKETHTEPAK